MIGMTEVMCTSHGEASTKRAMPILHVDYVGFSVVYGQSGHYSRDEKEELIKHITFHCHFV